ncbi:MAG: HaeII family restriction endonuclease, partial [Chitinispirillales bacterium]|jgi:hypothetical protein|nr:HaeII family restriction endonuclease [Chitinispirillales bacterium]
MENELTYCVSKIEKMLSRSTTKVIFPIITFGLVKEFCETQNDFFADANVRECYKNAVQYFKEYLGHSLHIGGKYYDAYPSRNLPKYGVLKTLDNKQYRLTEEYKKSAPDLVTLIPKLVKDFISAKMGKIPNLETVEDQLEIAKEKDVFLQLIKQQININSSNFEIFSFAVLKTHLEKFACKLYRDTRTYAHDKGVDLSTNFGVVYQIKKLKLQNQNNADVIFKELQTNFSDERIKDGNVVIIIDDITKEVKSYLINMKVQSLSKEDILGIASLFELEERLKVLRVVFDEFSREYKSDI